MEASSTFLEFYASNRSFVLSVAAVLFLYVSVLLGTLYVKLRATIRSPAFLRWVSRNDRMIALVAAGAAFSAILGLVATALSPAVVHTLSDAASYERQLATLNGIESSLTTLSAFVVAQKQRLQESEAVLDSLRKEHDTLTPIVETDRKVVDSIFALQSQRAANTIWTERIVGFSFGVLASLVASFLLAVLQRFRKRAASAAV